MPSNPLEVQNFVEMWAAHMEQMSDYNAFVLPIEDMTRLMNYKTDNDTVRSVMQERYGNQVPDYILAFLRRLNGNAKSEMGSALVNKLVSGAKGAAVGGNLSVASQQATAVLRAYALIDAKYLVKGMGAGALSAAKMKKSYAEIMDWAPMRPRTCRRQLRGSRSDLSFAMRKTTLPRKKAGVTLTRT